MTVFWSGIMSGLAVQEKMKELNNNMKRDVFQKCVGEEDCTNIVDSWKLCRIYSSAASGISMRTGSLE